MLKGLYVGFKSDGVGQGKGLFQFVVRQIEFTFQVLLIARGKCFFTN